MSTTLENAILLGTILCFYHVLYYIRFDSLLCNLVDFLQRYVSFCGDAAACFVFGGCADKTSSQAFHFHGDQAKGGFDLFLGTLSFESLHLLYAYTQGTGFAQQHMCESITFFQGTNDADQGRRTILFHLHGKVSNVQCTSREQLLHQITEEFTAHIVDVAFYDRHPIGIGRLMRCIGNFFSLPQAETQAVRPGELFLSKAIAYSL